MFRLHLTCERRVIITFVFFVWSSLRRRQNRTGQGGGFGCDSVADFSVTERREYSFDRPNIGSNDGPSSYQRFCCTSFQNWITALYYVVNIKTISIRRAPWAGFNDNHLPIKRQPSIFRAANYHLKTFVAGKTEPRTQCSVTHRITVLRDVQTEVKVS